TLLLVDDDNRLPLVFASARQRFRRRCSKQFCAYCIIGSMPLTGAFSPAMAAYVDFCLIEKGLSANSIDACRRDLRRLEAFSAKACGGQLPGAPELLAYLDLLYQQRLSSRTIARHLSTIRNLYAFLLRDRKI